MNQDTKPMKRLPDSAPRIPKKFRFWILFGIGIDLALLGLLLVVLYTPVNPNYPSGNPILPESVPQTSLSVVLSPQASRTTATRATVKPSKTVTVHRQETHTPKASATRTAVPTKTPTPPVPTPTVVPKPRPTPTDPTPS